MYQIEINYYVLLVLYLINIIIYFIFIAPKLLPVLLNKIKSKIYTDAESEVFFSIHIILLIFIRLVA